MMTPICKAILTSSLFFNPIWLNAHEDIKQEAISVCEEVVAKADKTGLDPVLMATLSYAESRFKRGVRSKVGAVGPLQVMPRWTCPGGERKGCDLVQAGLNHVRRLAHRYGCGEESKAHAEKLLKWEGVSVFNEWADETELCAEPDWETVLCHYNSGLVCASRGFPRFILSRAKKVRAMLEEDE